GPRQNLPPSAREPTRQAEREGDGKSGTGGSATALASRPPSPPRTRRNSCSGHSDKRRLRCPSPATAGPDGEAGGPRTTRSPRKRSVHSPAYPPTKTDILQPMVYIFILHNFPPQWKRLISRTILFARRKSTKKGDHPPPRSDRQGPRIHAGSRFARSDIEENDPSIPRPASPAQPWLFHRFRLPMGPAGRQLFPIASLRNQAHGPGVSLSHASGNFQIPRISRQNLPYPQKTPPLQAEFDRPGASVVPL